MSVLDFSGVQNHRVVVGQSGNPSSELSAYHIRGFELEMEGWLVGDVLSQEM